MTVSYFYNDFELLNDLNPDYTWAGAPQDGSRKAVVDAFVNEFRPLGQIFTPTLITFGNLGYYASTQNQYSGDFQQADDGTISGTITGIFSYSVSLSITVVGTPFAPSGSGVPGASKIPELIVSGLRKTDFEILDLEIDFETFFASLMASPEDVSVPSVETLLFSGDDLVRAVVRSEETPPFEVRGYGGDDRVEPLSRFDEAKNNLFGDEGNDTLYGYAGDDNLNGGDGIDHLYGDEGDDSLNGDDGNDRLVDSVGTNVLNGGRGDDFLSGSRSIGGVYEGHTTAVYEGNSSSYTLKLNGRESSEANTITDRVADRDGTDVFERIQQLDFLDTSLTIDLAETYLSSSSSQMAEIATLYTAYFNRAPDALGLYYWAAQSRDGMSLNDMSAYFSQSDEAQSIHTFNGPADVFVTAVYENVLNRSPDPEGLAFWAAVLDSGVLPRSTFILDLIRGALTDPMTEESAEMAQQRAADVVYLESTAELGLYFARDKGMTNVENAYSVFDMFDGTAESLEASKDAVDAFYAAALDPLDGELLVQMTGFRDDPFFF